MLANPEQGVNTGTFAALDQATASPTEKTVNPEETGENQALIADPDQGNPRTFKAKLDDKEIEFEVKSGDVDLESLPTSLMMSHTFYKKTEELAAERKAFKEKSEGFDKELDELRSQLDYGMHLMDSPEMVNLKESDPSEYWERYGKLKTKYDKYQSYISEKKGEKEKATQDLIRKEVENWTTVIPEWLDSDVKKRESGEIFNTLSKAGFEPEMIGNIYDSRLVGLLRKAMLYDKAQSKTLVNDKKPTVHVKSNSTATETKTEPKKSIEEIFYGS
jgi:hypothetical protein